MVMRAMVMRASKRARPASCLPPYNNLSVVVCVSSVGSRESGATIDDADADRVRRGHSHRRKHRCGHGHDAASASTGARSDEKRDSALRLTI